MQSVSQATWPDQLMTSCSKLTTITVQQHWIIVYVWISRWKIDCKDCICRMHKRGSKSNVNCPIKECDFFKVMIKWQLNLLVVSFLPSPITHSIAYKTLTWAMNDFTIAERSDAPEHWLWHQQRVPQTMRIGLQKIICGEVSWYSSEQAIMKSAWIRWLHLPAIPQIIFCRYDEC